MFAILLCPFVVVAGIIIVVGVTIANKRRPAFAPMPRPTGGSMGRLNQPMNPKQAANTIYANLQSQGGFQQGRVYSTGYLSQMAGMPYIADMAERWFYWNLVFGELNMLMGANGFGYYGSPYQYGDDYAFGFGQPQYFYGDPASDPSSFDPGMAQNIELQQDSAAMMGNEMADQFQTADTADQLGVNSPADLGDNSSWSSSGPDSGTTDFGGSDFGGSDFGGSDSG